MKTIIAFFSRGSGDSGRSGASFAGAFDEDWNRHLRSYERLCSAYSLAGEDKLEFLRITLRTGALDFYDDSTLTRGTPYRVVVQAFNARYDSPTRREENSKILSALLLSATRGAERDDHAALKTFVERIELLAPISSIQDRDSEAKSRVLLNAVSGEEWYLHAESKLSYPYDFANVIDALHESIWAVQAHATRVKISSSEEASQATPRFTA